MKRLSIFIGTFIIFYTTACSTTSPLNVEQNLLSKTDIKPKFGDGGNPEVENKVNYCLMLKGHIQIECLEKLYPHDQNILIHPSHGKRIKLATRGMGSKRRTLQLKGETRILLYIDKSYVPIPLKCNIKDSHITQDKNSIVIDILTKNIRDKIILKDKEGHVLGEYSIIRSTE